MTIILEDINLILLIKILCNGSSARRCQSCTINKNHIEAMLKAGNFIPFIKARCIGDSTRKYQRCTINENHI